MGRAASLWIFFIWIASASAAEVLHEISPDQIRASVAAGNSLSVDAALQLVKTQDIGKVVDVRAFKGHRTYYRVLTLRPNGQIVAYIVDATSGSLLSPGSSASHNVEDTAEGQRGGGKANAAGEAEAGSGRGANGNASGGSGNGGSGGNNGSGGSGGGHGGSGRGK